MRRATLDDLEIKELVVKLEAQVGAARRGAPLWRDCGLILAPLFGKAPPRSGTAVLADGAGSLHSGLAPLSGFVNPPC